MSYKNACLHLLNIQDKNGHCSTSTLQILPEVYFLALLNWKLKWMGILRHVAQSGQVTILRSYHVPGSFVPLVFVPTLSPWFQISFASISQYLQPFLLRDELGLLELLSLEVPGSFLPSRAALDL